MSGLTIAKILAAKRSMEAEEPLKGLYLYIPDPVQAAAFRTAIFPVPPENPVKNYPVKITLLDTQTGERREVVEPDWHVYRWEGGNWSCDCNRYGYFDLDDPPEFEQDTCCGSKRFLVVAIDKPVSDEQDTDLRRLNLDYPEELLREHGIIE